MEAMVRSRAAPAKAVVILALNKPAAAPNLVSSQGAFVMVGQRLAPAPAALLAPAVACLDRCRTCLSRWHPGHAAGPDSAANQARKWITSRSVRSVNTQ